WSWRWVMERRKFTREFKLEAVRLIKDRGVSYGQASQDLNVHSSQLRDGVKKFSDDPQHAFPGHGQMKPEQLEIVRLKREVTKPDAQQTWTSVPFFWIAPTSMGGIATCGLIHCNIRPQLRTEQESEVPMHGSENNETAPPEKEEHSGVQRP